MNYSKDDLVHYRLSRAKESLDEARLLSQSNHWNTTANRLYYACFYAASAYIISKGLEANTYNGIKSAFNHELIKSGKLDQEYGKLYNNLFNLRQDADYRDYKDVTEEQIAPLVSMVESLLHKVEELLQEEK